jgi:DNA modification methylase
MPANTKLEKARAWQNRIVGHGEADPEQLLANPRNWRIHPREQEEALRAVLDKVGWVQQVVLNQRTGFVVDGHLRVSMAIARREKVPVSYVDLSPAEESLILATFDRVTELANVDRDKLDELVLDAVAEFPDLKGVLDDIDLLISGEAPALVEGLTDADSAPKLPEHPVTQPGDVWLLGPHRLLCGDATSADAVSRVCGATVPFLMATDPPYGVQYEPEWREEGGLNPRTVQGGKVQNDDRVDWTAAWQLFTGDVAYVWHAGIYAGEVAATLSAATFRIRGQIIWRKQHFVISRGAYHWQHEPCWYAVRNGKTAHWRGDRTQSTVWDVQNLNPHGGNLDEKTTGHGTQKPIELMRRPILNHTKRGETVYDPFLGSGTTLVACEMTERQCIGIDIDPKYVDVALLRWQDFAGKQATLEGNGRSFASITTERLPINRRGQGEINKKQRQA